MLPYRELLPLWMTVSRLEGSRRVMSTIGVLEFTSIAAGYEAEDVMLKAGAVTLILARTICSGKFIVIVSGDVDAVKAAVSAGKKAASGYIVDELVLPYVDPAVFTHPSTADLWVMVDGSECWTEK